VPVLDYRVDSEGLEKLKDTFLGKTVLVTSQTQWTDSDVIEAYRSQYLIEDIFRQMKDRQLGCWWPMYHWTDWMIQVHGFYCTVALLLRALVAEAARVGGMQLPVGKLWTELAGIKKVVNVYAKAGAGGSHVRQNVWTKLTLEQKHLIEALKLQG
jgi:transposase